MFARGRKTEQFCEARFVRFARGTIASGLDPLGVLRAQGVMDLPLKLNVRSSDFGRGPRKRARFHTQTSRRRSEQRYFACVGFFTATHEVIQAPSFEIPSTCLRTDADCTSLFSASEQAHSSENRQLVRLQHGWDQPQRARLASRNRDEALAIIDT